MVPRRGDAGALRAEPLATLLSCAVKKKNQVARERYAMSALRLFHNIEG